MDHYVDIVVQTDPEFPVNQLLSALYAKLHRALVAQNSTTIGVSFPDFCPQQPHLGARLRLHGDIDALSALLSGDWIAGMRDFVMLTPIARVPENAKYCHVRRVQAKSSVERLRRRLMRRHNIDEDEARSRIPFERAAHTVHLPFLMVRSTSTGQSFRLFIHHGPVQPDPVAGDFNTYGLSRAATVPWF